MIGVFDSGVGGLTVLKYFLKELPEYNYIYLGDTARAPYGSKSQESIYSYTREVVDFLFSKGCKLVIIACNTSSSQALRKIQQEYLPKKYPDRRVLGVIRPLVEEVAKEKNIKRVGVIGTKATIRSNVYKIELGKLSPDLEVFQKSAPLLVPLIEEGWIKKVETRRVLKKYLRPLKEKKVQALILACTHYPFLLKDIKIIMGKNCKVYNPGEIVTKSLKEYLGKHPELKLKKQPNPKYQFYTTDDHSIFKELGDKFLGQDIESIEKIKL